MELWLCNCNNRHACSEATYYSVELQMMERSDFLFHHQIKIGGAFSKTAGKRVTLSFFGAVRFFGFGLFWSPIQYWLQPM